MMTTADITASLQKYWKANGPQGVTTVFSGTTIDVSDQLSWLEFWTSQLHESPKRPDTPEQFRLVIDIHFFSRDNNKRTINSLIDATRITFQPTSIPVNSASSSTTQVGQLRCFEPIIRDLSRSESAGATNVIQHFVCSFSATVTGLIN